MVNKFVIAYTSKDVEYQSLEATPLDKAIAEMASDRHDVQEEVESNSKAGLNNAFDDPEGDLFFEI